jgi:ABC-type antimicrobial peptide transport system permease subunit
MIDSGAMAKYFTTIEEIGFYGVSTSKLPPMPETIRLSNDDTEYQVVGRVNGAINNAGESHIVIPKQTFIEKGYPIVEITILTEKRASTAQIQALDEYLRTAIPEAAFKISAKVDDVQQQRVNEYLYELAITAFLGVLACINAVSIVGYWVYQRRQVYSVYITCGMYRGQLTAMLLLEVFFITTLAFALGAVLYRVFDYFVPRVMYAYPLSWQEQGAIYAFIEVVSLLLVYIQYRFLMARDILAIGNR